jgi:cephalosporin hydroxylase
MNPFTVFLKRTASFVKSMLPTPPKHNVEEILSSTIGKDITDRFIDLYYTSLGAYGVNWKGHELLKNPCDLWIYIELIQKIKPKYIIETGTHFGASALYFSDMVKMLGIDTTIITIDINPKLNFDATAAKIISLRGISTSTSIVNEVSRIIKPEDIVLVMLDSDHSKENVLNELNAYSRFVTLNSYLIVEDTIVNGHPTNLAHGPGPFEATQEFLSKNNNFEVDLDCQKFLLTYNNRGFLKRIR